VAALLRLHRHTVKEIDKKTLQKIQAQRVSGHPNAARAGRVKIRHLG